MTLVEDKYRSELAQWSGQRRVRRSAALLSEMRKMLARKLTAVEPNLDGDELNRRIAECLYRTDAVTQRLLSLAKR